MTGLVVIAVFMTALTIAWLLWPALRTRPAETTGTARTGSGRVLGGAVSATVIAIAVGGYVLWGTPAALDPARLVAAPQTEAEQRAAAEAARSELRARTEREPTNAIAWAELARAEVVLGLLPDAIASFRRSLDLRPENPDTLADLADAIAVHTSRTLEGEPAQLIERALRADPNHVKALALSGIAALQRGDPGTALAAWERAVERAHPDDPIGQELRAALTQARQQAAAMKAAQATPAAGFTGGPAVAAPAVAPAGQGAPVGAAATAATAAATTAPGATRAAEAVSGRVSLAPALASRVKPDDTVFVFARPADGSRMPLAIQRFRVRDLPVDFTLDDRQSMSPAAKLSGATAVMIGARVSKSGQATPQPGDLQGVSGPVAPGASGVIVTISETVSP